MHSGGADAADELPNSTPPPSTAASKDEYRSALLSFDSTGGGGPLAGHSSTSDSSSYSMDGIHGESGHNFITNNEAIRDLRSIAGRDITAGHSRECIHVYSSVRKSTMDQSFKILGIENSSPKIVQRLDWYLQQEKIRRWLRNAVICVQVLFPEERRSSELIFKGLGNFDSHDVCFAQTVNDHAILLFNFVESISNGGKSPEKLFRILDLYTVMSNLSVDLKTVFQSKLGEIVCRKAANILFTLAARAILLEFEKAVIGVLMESGSIHPLNKAVMNYVDSMVDYKQILIELIVSKPFSDSPETELDLSEFE